MSHRPGSTEILRLVAQRLDDHRGDDLLTVALESPGVLDTFDDEVELVAALLLRWHTRLTAELDQSVGHESRDPSRAAEQGWVRTCQAMPGTRLLLDQVLATATSARLEHLLLDSAAKEHARLASAAGLAAADEEATVRAGRTLQGRARARLEQDADERERALRLAARTEEARRAASTAPVPVVTPGASARFVERLRALVPA